MIFTKNKIKESVSRIVKPTTTSPTVYIKYPALVKMNQFAQNCDKEIGWLGSAVKNEDGSYTIEDMYLIKQKVTAVTTELEESAILQFMNDIKKTEGIEAMSKIRVWGHSHVDMGVFASSQDNETFKEYYEDCNFFIRIIVNKKGEMKLDVADNESGLVYENIPWVVIYEKNIEDLIKEYEEINSKLTKISNDLEEELNKYKQPDDVIKSEIKTKVIEESTVYTKRDTNGYHGNLNYVYDYYYGKYSEPSDSSINEDKNKDDELEERYYKNLYKSLDNEKTIPVKKNNNVIRYQKVTDALSPGEIEEITELCYSYKDAKTLLKGDKRFEGYSNKEWAALYNSCLNIQARVIEEESVS